MLKKTPLRIAVACLALWSAAALSQPQTPENGWFPSRDVAASISRSVGKPVLVDPRVPQLFLGSLTPDQVTLPVLIELVALQGSAIVERDDSVLIVNEGAIRSTALPIMQRDDPDVHDDQWVTRVVRTSNVDPNALVAILRPLLPQAAHLASTANGLVIVDRYGNVKRITEIVRELDRN